jgi:hypothetical protein
VAALVTAWATDGFGLFIDRTPGGKEGRAGHGNIVGLWEAEACLLLIWAPPLALIGHVHAHNNHWSCLNDLYVHACARVKRSRSMPVQDRRQEMRAMRSTYICIHIHIFCMMLLRTTLPRITRSAPFPPVSSRDAISCRGLVSLSHKHDRKTHKTQYIGLGLWPLSLLFIMRGVQVPYIEMWDPSGAKQVFANITLTKVT